MMMWLISQVFLVVMYSKKETILVPYFESTNLSLLGKCALWNFDGKCLPFTSIVELFYNYWKTLFVGLQEQTNPSKHLWI